MISDNVDFVIRNVSIKNTTAVFDCCVAFIQSILDNNSANIIFCTQEKGSNTLTELNDYKYCLGNNNTTPEDGYSLLTKTSFLQIQIDLTKNEEGFVSNERWYRQFYLVIKNNDNKILYKSKLYTLFSEQQYYPKLKIISYKPISTTTIIDDTESVDRKIQFKVKKYTDEPVNYLYNKNCYYINGTLSYTNKDGIRTNDELDNITDTSTNTLVVDISQDNLVYNSNYKYATITLNTCAKNGDVINSITKTFCFRNNWTDVYIKTHSGIKRIKSVGIYDVSKKKQVFCDLHISTHTSTS